MNTITIDVTPQIAQAWLAENNNNRNLREKVVSILAKEMKEGRWHQTHQGIAFYQDGTLADGQHRLNAIIRSGTTQKFAVTFNLPREAAIGIDIGSSREMHDVLRITGAPKWLDKNAVAMIRACLAGLGKNMQKVSPHEITKYADKYHHFILDALEFTGPSKKRLTSALLSANYFCALNAGVDREVVKRFGEVLQSGIALAEHETAAIRLREFLLTVGRPSGGDRLETSKKIQKAIALFNDRVNVIRLRAINELTYPIPE